MWFIIAVLHKDTCVELEAYHEESIFSTVYTRPAEVEHENGSASQNTEHPQCLVHFFYMIYIILNRI